MHNIITEVKKLNRCLKQVENLNPSGASDEDIVSIYSTFYINILFEYLILHLQ